MNKKINVVIIDNEYQKVKSKNFTTIKKIK